MKCKKLEQINPIPPSLKREYVITAQMTGDILLLDVYKSGSYQGRQAINTVSGEYMQYNMDDGKWRFRKFGNLLGFDMSPAGYYSSYTAAQRTNIDSEDMKKLVEEGIKKVTKIPLQGDIFWEIYRAESQYSEIKRQRIEDNRVMKVQDKMRLVPEVPESARDWIWEKEGAEQYIFRDKEKRWHCTACKKSYSEKLLQREDKKVARHNDRVICPKCGAVATAKTKTNNIEEKTHFYLAQRIDNRMSVWRSFDVRLVWTPDGRKTILNEGFRFIIYSLSVGSKYAGELFYNQYATGGLVGKDPEYAYFDNKRNPSNRRGGEGYLYPEGLKEAFNDTAYDHVARFAQQISKSALKLNYNRIMSIQGECRLTEIMEYLYKGRFWKLLKETINDIWIIGGGYYGPLDIAGKTQEEIFELSDRQLINRLRDENGGECMLKWLRYSEEKRMKINRETMQWLEKNNIREDDISFIINRMTPQQIMNYVSRQQAESYKGKSAKSVIAQWEDYLSMLRKIGKKTSDEMIYRPRELKRRHDECVEEINAQRIREEMQKNAQQRRRESQKMNQRFPGAEKVLQEIRDKYTYEDDQYKIIVPEYLIDIITEGQALHHCAGATDRYFDRIMQRETYICFLRKKHDPDTPFYTIEVEPGGTIRQHRGYLDEEPGIEQIRPFLRKWQQEIKRRMTKEDKEHAAASAVKRQQNIEELRAKNNTRVLRGLMEDFMPAEQEEPDNADRDLMAAGA